MSNSKIKICGLASSAAVDAAVEVGVDYIGCIFDINSIQYVSPLFARDICVDLPSSIKKVAVVSEISDKQLNEIITYFKPDYVQFNGNANIEYLKLFREKFDIKIIKTIYLSAKKDLEVVNKYQGLVDIFLFEPESHYLDKHSSQKKKFFDWQVFSKIQMETPWMISGNISKHNLAFILRASKANMISVDESLNSSLGVKDPFLIKEFMKIFRGLCSDTYQ